MSTKLRTSIVPFLCVLASALTLGAQVIPKNDILYKNITSYDGLPNENINQIIKDSYGFIWVATNDGLCRYEADQSIRVFKANDETVVDGLRSSSIRSLYADTKGNIWAGTLGGGLTRYHQESDEWTTFLHISSDSNSISSNEILCITEDSKGRIWVGTEDGLNKFNAVDNSFTKFQYKNKEEYTLQAKAVLNIFEDNKGWIWIGTWAGGLHLLIEDEDIANSKFKSIPISSSKHSLNVWKIYQDKKDRYWLGTHKGGLFLMDIPMDAHPHTDWQPKIWNYSNELNEESSISHNSILDIHQDNNNNLWICTGHGLNKIDAQDIPSPVSIKHSDTKPPIKFNRFFKNPANPSPLIGNYILDILEDDQGLMWIGTYNGVSQFSVHESIFEVFEITTHENHLPNTQNLYIDTSNTAWVATQANGIHKFNLNTGEYYPFEQNYKLDKNVTSVYSPDDISLYIAMRSGVSVLNLESKQMYQFPTPDWLLESFENFEIRNIFQDRKNRVWIGSETGLILIDDSSGEFQLHVNDPADTTSLTSNTINSVFEDSYGNIWVATYNGLNKLPYDALDSIYFEQIKQDANGTSIPSNRITQIIELNGQLYFGTTTGLFSYDFKTKAYTNHSSNNNKLSIQNLQVTSDNNIWGSSTSGLFYFDTQSGTFNKFDKNDGLNNMTFRQGGGVKGKDGNFYFTNTTSIIKFTPDDIQFNDKKPPVYITDIYSNSFRGQEQFSGLIEDNMELSYNHHSINFNFTALNYNRSEKNKYAFKLEGFDEEWNYDSKNTQVTYTNLDPGDYTFKVKASNNDGVWNEEGDAIEIYVKPALWDTWWFKAGIILGSLLILYLIFSNILNRNKSLAEYNTKLSQEVKQRQIAEKKVEQREQFLRLIMDNIPQSVFWVDKSYKIQGANAAFLKEIQLENESLIKGGTLEQIFITEDLVKDQKRQINKVLQSEKSINSYVSQIYNSVTNKNEWVQQDFMPLYNDKQLMGVLVTGEEITQRIEAEEVLKDHSKKLENKVKIRTQELAKKNDEIEQLLSQLQNRNVELESIVEKRTQKLRESNQELIRSNDDLEQFAYIASHDLQEPLRIITNFVGLLSRKYESQLDDTAFKYIEFITSSASRMTLLIKNILTYSKVGGKEIDIIEADINDVVSKKLLDLSQRISERNANINLEPLPTIFCEPNQLGIVFYNLINNAIKFNESDRPEVTVSFYNDEKNNAYQFAVKDNGIGIEPKYQKQIFDIFKRLHNKQDYEGTGIGLSLCKKIIDRHGGKIWINSIPGKETTFFFTVSKDISNEKSNPQPLEDLAELEEVLKS